MQDVFAHVFTCSYVSLLDKHDMIHLEDGNKIHGSISIEENGVKTKLPSITGKALPQI